MVQAQCERVIEQMQRAELAPGLVFKPILPVGFFHETRINQSLRLVFWIGANNEAFLEDICTHDELPRYGRMHAPE